MLIPISEYNRTLDGSFHRKTMSGLNLKSVLRVLAQSSVRLLSFSGRLPNFGKTYSRRAGWGDLRFHANRVSHEVCVRF